MLLQIYRGYFVNESHDVDEGTVMNAQFFGQSQITSRIESNRTLDIAIKDYIRWGNLKYYVNQQPNITKNASNNFIYDITFESQYYNFIKAQYLTGGSGEFYLTTDAEGFIDLLLTNINRVHFAEFGANVWTKGTIDQTDKTYKNLHFKDQNCRSVIQTICQEFSGEIYFKNYQINFTDKLEYDTGYSLEYRSGLRNISKLAESEKNIVTRVYGYGSDKNLGTAYRTGKQRLEFSDGGKNYLEKNVATYGLIEHSITFDEIYPHYEGTLTHISPSDKTYIRDTNINFDINSYLISGVAAKVHFNTGDLAGYEFEILQYDVDDDSMNIIKIKTAIGIAELPDDDLKPAVGDKYTFVDIIMPAAYITTAETALQAATQSFIDDNSVVRVKYQVTADNRWFDTYGYSFNLGDKFTITDTDLGINASVRITELSYPLYKPTQYTMVLSNFVDPTFLQTLYNDNDGLKNGRDIDKGGDIPNSYRNWRKDDSLRNIIIAPDGYINIGLLTADNIQVGRLESADGFTYFDLDTNVLVMASGAATIAGTNITSIQNGADVTATVLTAKGIADGATAGATWGSNLGSIPTRFTDTVPPSGSGLCITASYLGFYTGGAFTAYMDNAGNLVLGDIAGGNNGLSWNQAGGTLTVQGTIQTAASGQRMIISNVDNTLKFYDSANELCVEIDDNITGAIPGMEMKSTVGAILIVRNDTDTDSSVFVGSDLANPRIRAFGNSNLTVVKAENKASTTIDENAVISAGYATGKTGVIFAGYVGTATKWKVDSSGNVYAAGAITGITGLTLASGNITLTAAGATVDGRDLTTDGSKLDGIATGATVGATWSSNITNQPSTFAPAAHALTAHSGGSDQQFILHDSGGWTATSFTTAVNNAVAAYLTALGGKDLTDTLDGRYLQFDNGVLIAITAP